MAAPDYTAEVNATVPDYDPRLGGYRIQITAEQLRRAPSLSGRSQDWPDRESEQDLHDFYQVSYYWLLP